jgi:transcriptional regulator with GAF, ATPase, and Fis domain
VSQTFVALARSALENESFNSTLQSVVDLACAGVRGCSMAGITLLDRSGPLTAVATSLTAAAVDAIQYRVNAGPCLDSYRRQVINRIDSTDTDERWPEFALNAAAAGVHSTLSFPLVVNGDGIGALNLYAADQSAFDERDERAGAVFATHAAVTLANARAFWRTDDLRRSLETALETRGIVDQAKGIVMARDRCNANDAFDSIRREAQRGNFTVQHLAQQIVDHSSRDSPDS